MTERLELSPSNIDLKGETRASNIAGLKALFEGSQDNIFLRGSFARGDFPYGDIDLSIHNVGSGINSLIYPQEFRGLPVSYTIIEQSAFLDYLDTSPRGWMGLMEMVNITATDQNVVDSIKRKREEILRERAIDFALYLTVEEDIYQRRFDISGTDYYSFKRKSGSKRTVLRAINILSALSHERDPESDMSTTLSKFVRQGLMPDSLSLDYRAISTMLEMQKVDPQEWIARTGNISKYMEELTDNVWTCAEEQLPKEYLSSLKLALDTTEDNVSLSDLMGRIDDVNPAYRRWVVLLCLATNSAISEDSLWSIWEKIGQSIQYKGVTRFLFRNSSFPIQRIDPNGLKDEHLKFTYNRRLSGYRD